MTAGPGSGHTTSWPVVLDALEAELDALEAAPVATIEAAVAFEPPAGLGPLPPTLVHRAGALVARIEQVSEHVDQLLADTRVARGRADRAGRLSTRAPLPASSLDISA